MLVANGRSADAIVEGVGYASAQLASSDLAPIASATGFACAVANREDEAERWYAIALANAKEDPPEELKTLFERRGRQGESLTSYASRLRASAKPVRTLAAIPDFSFRQSDGTTGTLSALRGKVVVIDCWGIGCGGCMVEEASMRRLADSIATEPRAALLSIASDDSARIVSFIRRHGIRYPIVTDGRRLHTRIGVEGYPTHFVIDAEGATIFSECAGMADTGDRLWALVTRTLSKK
jgi:peroxiredoxin